MGSELLGYRLEALLGRGGMGVVYRAHDPRLKRDVALKLLAPEYASDLRFRERFLSETERAASLEHPNVIPIHDAGEVDGQLYLVMRLAPGGDLKRLLTDEQSLEPRRAISICAQIADALDAAHARGLIHRDVKPSNVLLDQRGHVYLADFGLSRTLSEQARGFEAGLSLGTPAYVAPEQIEGKDADGRADQYSLACVLTECLSGKPPFPRPTEAAVLFAHLEEDPRPVAGLAGILGRALAKEPRDRHESCAAFVQAAREGLGIAGPRPRRWPLPLAAVATAVAAAAVAFLLVRDEAAAPPATTGRLIRIDPAAGRDTATIPVGSEPVALAVGESGIWIADRADGRVRRVDPATLRVELETSAHGKPTGIGLAGERVVVSNGPQDASAVVIDAATGREENVISLAAGGFFVGSARVTAGGSDTWVAAGDRRVGRLDVTRSRLVDPIVIEGPRDERSHAYFSAVAASDDAVWVVGDVLDPTLWRIDPATGDVTAKIPLPFAPTDVAVGAGAVWVSSQLEDRVSRIDPATRRLTGSVRVGRGAAALSVGAGSVWVANAVDGTVSRIDPHTLRVGETLEVGARPDDVVATDNAIWVAARDAPTGVPDAGEVRIGVLTACEGTYGLFSDASLAGAELPLLRRGARLAGPGPADGLTGATAAGKPLRLFFACGDQTAGKALSEARRLVEQVGVEILIGPSFISEGFAIQEYARRRPEVTFVGGTAPAQAMTLHDPAANLFRFSPDGAQLMGGVGAYAYRELGWRHVVIAGDAEAFTYSQAAGFAAEFCSLGGKVVRHVWVPLGTADYGPYLARTPRRGVDGYVMPSFTPTTLALTEGLTPRGNLGDKLIVGVLVASLEGFGDRFAGVVFGMPVPGPGGMPAAGQREWVRYVEDFAGAFPGLAQFGPSLFPVAYMNAMTAVLEALDAVGGDLADDQRRFRAALAKIELDAPNGRIRLDGNRQAVAPNYLHRIEKGADGRLTARTIGVVPNVEQTFGGYFAQGDPSPGRDTIACRRGSPPPWAHP